MFDRSPHHATPGARGVRSPVVETAIAKSIFATLPPAEVDALFDAGRLIDVPARTVVPPSVYASHAALVVDGLSRIYVFAPNGREATIGYRRCGEFLMPVGEPLPPLRVQALTHCQAWLFPLSSVLACLEREVEFGAVLARYFSDLQHMGFAEFRFSLFATVRQQVARHLVAMATRDASERLVSRVSVRELAHSLGSVREVVSREIRRLARDGWIAPQKDGYLLLQPDRLCELFAELLGHHPQLP